MRIIPAIDIIDGKCVRLTQGDYGQKKIYNDDPVAVATQFENAGLKYLHLVDLDGAKAGSVINWSVIENITRKTSLIVDFGGGIKTDYEIKRLFASGVHQVNLGSIAVKNKPQVLNWLSEFGEDKIILSADVKNEMIAISGWQENSNITIFEFIGHYIKNGIKYITCTDINTDGMLQGPNISLYQKIIAEFPAIKLVASGGVSSIQDVRLLTEKGIDGIIIGKALYESKIELPDLLKF